jgi:DNA-binding GntR family transcriptional regulator
VASAQQPDPADDIGAARADTSPDHASTPRTGGTVIAVRDMLREAMINGDLQPGTPLSSVQLAKTYGVSRTPLREALRMLQNEGFVEVENNHRPRVARWSVEELEAVFAQRILLTALGTRLSVAHLTVEDIDAMGAALARIEDGAKAGDHDAWREADRVFHELHMSRSSDVLRADLRRLTERALMFRYMWFGRRPNTMSFTLDDHPEIFEACRAKDAPQASRMAARHLARVALTLIAKVAPDHDPEVVREALRFASVDSSELRVDV